MPDRFGPYQKLLKRAHQIALVSTAAETLNWDLETSMPPKALAFRAEQLAHFGRTKHRLFIAKSTGEWLAACEQNDFASDSLEAANVREWRRLYDRATKIPPSLVEKFERTRTHARAVWKEARQKSDFKIFKPHLEKMVDLNRRRADRWGFAESPYDALLAEFEPGARTAQVRSLLTELRPALAPVLTAARERAATISENILKGNYPVAAQQAFNREVAEAIGFDFQAGRIDTTTHPFCTTLGPADNRLTTRYNEQDFTQSLYGILHEAGHGLYEQGLPAEHFGTPLATAASLGIHESQSRLWENHVGRDPAFWERWHSVACGHFPELKRLTPTQIANAVNRVSPSFIRVEADQVTYDLHIILRFEVEVRLVQGELPVRDVPGFWNEEFEKMLGLKVTRDSEGCLQDPHWSLGDMGYFPTYSLGNLNAAQLMHQARLDHPSLSQELAQGEYGSLLKWLREKIHRHGLRYLPQDLIQRTTGEPTGIAHHVEYLRQKFAAV
jgi:carboxypeptidase Taq